MYKMIIWFDISYIKGINYSFSWRDKYDHIFWFVVMSKVLNILQNLQVQLDTKFLITIEDLMFNDSAIYNITLTIK